MERVNTLYHFGDSFATSCEFEPIFTEYMAKELCMHWRGYGLPGGCNEQIFSEILKNLHKFKEGDLLVINWSSFSRISYSPHNEFKLKSANKLIEEFGHNEEGVEGITDNYKDFLLESASNMNYDNSSKIFKSHLPALQKYFKKIGIKFIQTFLSNDLYLDSKKIDSFKTFIDVENLIYFEPPLPNILSDGSYRMWLLNKNWGNEECCHYTSGIQPDLSKYFIEKYYNNFYSK